MKKNRKFVVKYFLNGIFKGYHIDTFCHLGEKDRAKIYDNEPADQIETIWVNFKEVWDNFGGKKRKTWKGCSLSQIQIVEEFID